MLVLIGQAQMLPTQRSAIFFLTTPVGLEETAHLAKVTATRPPPFPATRLRLGIHFR